MAVKTFTAGSMQAAVAKVKENLGRDAIILSTRRIPRGANNPYGRDVFEVDAEKPDINPDEFPGNLLDLTGKRELDSLAHRDITDEKPVESGWKAVQSELSTLKELMLLSSRAEEERLAMRDSSTQKILHTLVRAGISEKRARHVVARAEERSAGGKTSISREVLAALVEPVKLSDPFNIRGTLKGKQVAAFVGPTGSGKTTTIAKMAAELYLKRGRKVGLISVDTYRIGAIDQLKTYASIMGIPFLPAFSRDDLVSALNKLERCDTIFVDTAGQSHLDTPRMKELKTILGESQALSVHLVLSAVTDRIDARDVVQRFSLLSPASLVFTKVDETKRAASIFDTMAESGLPLSIITNGQRVPEDLVIANKKSVVGLVLGQSASNNDTEQSN